MEVRLFYRKLLLPFAAFSLFVVAELPSSSKAEDEFLFTRSQPGLERLWSSVLGCAGRHDPFTIRNRLDDSEDAGGGPAPAGTSNDYFECGKHALRSASSRILVGTIEDALRQGGLAFNENFRLDSSVGWAWGEGFAGEFDAVVPVPLFSPDPGGAEKRERALFVQPGLVFWPGLGEEKRIDGNLGLVYRQRAADNLIAGGSLFYDHSFEYGQQRLGVGIDVQGEILRAGLNYYHPLSDDWTEGRTDYEEQILQGGDFRLGVAWRLVQLDASVGVWRFEGEEEDEKAKWRPSFSVDAGVRVLPGVFLEAGYEQHDEDDSFGSRWNTGVAIRFTLPGLDGAAALSDSVSAPDPFKPVEREKRILYEEREAAAKPVLLEPRDENGRLLRSSSIEEGSTVTITGRLEEALPVPAVLELVIDEDASSTDLGDDFLYGHKVYMLDADTGMQSAPSDATNCPAATCDMMIPEGVTRFDVEIEILDDDSTDPEEVPEEIVLRVDVPEEHQDVIRGGETTVTIRAHGNIIMFASDAPTTLDENGGTARITVAIGGPSPAPMRLSVAVSGSAEVGDDYTISTTTLSIPANTGSASLTLTGINDRLPEGTEEITLTLSGNLPEGWNFGPATDPDDPPSSIMHSITLLDDDLAIGFATPSDGDAFNPARVFEENPTSGMQQSVTVRVESTQAAPSEGFDLAWEVGSMEGGDQVTSTSGAVDFSSGDSHKEFTLTIDNDNMQEGETPVTVRLSTPTSLPTGWNFGVQEYTFTIETSDTHVSFASNVTDMTVNEGDTITFGLEIENVVAPSTGIPLRIQFLEGNNAAREDFSFVEGHIFPAGERTYNFTIEVIDDTDAENTEEYTLTLSANDGFPNGWGTVTTNGHAITINPSDVTTSFHYSGSSSVSAGDTVQIEMQLSTALSQEIKLNLVNDGTATYGKSSGDWNVRTSFLSSSADPNVMISLKDNNVPLCNSVTGSDCQITMATGTHRALVEIEIHSNATFGRTIQPSIVVPSEFSDFVEFDSTSKPTLIIVSGS